MHKSWCVGKVQNAVVITYYYCCADYSVRHLNENNKNTKHAQTLKSPPLQEGPNLHDNNVNITIHIRRCQDSLQHAVQ